MHIFGKRCFVIGCFLKIIVSMEVINWDVELSWVLESLLTLFTIRPFDPALGMCCLVTLVAHHGNNGNSALYCTLNTVLPVWVVYNGEYSVVYKLQTYQLCAHCVLYSQFAEQCKTHTCIQKQSCATQCTATLPVTVSPLLLKQPTSTLSFLQPLE